MISDIVMITLNVILVVFSLYTWFKVVKNKCSVKFIIFSLFILILIIYNCVFSTIRIMLPDDIIIQIMTGFTENRKYAYAMTALQFYENSISYIFVFMTFYILYKFIKTLRQYMMTIKNKNNADKK